MALQYGSEGGNEGELQHRRGGGSEREGVCMVQDLREQRVVAA